ncbi:MAG: hypothetical protein J7J25_03960 [Candidatus Omnitrophica bacterium]|nr:hypothetical protein [Candidatus Omnitrophota bacterium]
MKNKRKYTIEDEKEKGFVRFLYLTKKGKYAQIDENSLPYSRIKEETEEIESCQEIYYYGLA